MAFLSASYAKLRGRAPVDPLGHIALAAAPLRWQRRSIGVVTVSTRDAGGVDAASLAALTEVADRSAKLLRRAQLDAISRAKHGRPLLIKGLSTAWQEVERKLDGLKLRKLLDGVRGQPPVHLQSLIGTIARFSAMLADLDGLIAEIDVNPLIGGPKGCIAVDALIVPKKG